MTLNELVADGDATPIHVLDEGGFDAWKAGASAAVVAFVRAAGFSPKPGQVLLLPGKTGLAGALLGWGDAARRTRSRFDFARVTTTLPPGTYRIGSLPEGFDLNEAALGWCLSGYAFTRYRNKEAPSPLQLVAPAGVDADRITAIAQAEALTRDLINTPANDMGPDALEDAARDLAAAFGANVDVTVGDALLDANLPMIHAVGRAAEQEPRLIDLRWGSADDPALTLVGKGVCFDTGGLNIKPSASMGLMKKDMGGAATVLGLARMIMATDAKVALRVLIPAVENAISASSMRPGDILTSRKGLTVEINNTDAEGRLVLADALALADEDKPAAIISMATLTGAARVAVGPDLAPFYTDDDKVAAALLAAGAAVADPLWRMPFWAPYEEMIEPGIADLDNAPKGGFAGSITAALFLRRFVTATPRYVHFDIYGWQPSAAPARPKGGVGQGARALFAALPVLTAND